MSIVHLQLKLWLLLKNLASKPHVLEKILDVNTKQLRSTTIREFKIKWMDKSIKYATCGDFLVQECNVLKRGSMLQA